MSASPSLTLLCPSCSEPVVAAELSPRCRACRAAITLQQGDDFTAGGPVARCASCASEALYVAKDFNKNLGVAIVALGCIGFYWGALAGFLSLVVTTIADRIVYRLRPVVTVCYACKSIYRDVALNPQHKGYELTFDETFEGTGQEPPFAPPAAHSPR